jgi:hypothetical protein
LRRRSLCRWRPLRLSRRLRLFWGIHRSWLLGLRRLLRNLLAMGPVPGPVGQRLLLGQTSGGCRRVRCALKAEAKSEHGHLIGAPSPGR